MSAATPDIGSLLAALGGGGAPGGPDAGGAPPDQGQDIPGLLKQALDLVSQAYQAETDPLDKEAIGKIMSSLDSLFAQEQKDKDQAMAGGTNMRLLRRNR